VKKKMNREGGNGFFGIFGSVWVEKHDLSGYG
jgi:hypothetical protein